MSMSPDDPDFLTRLQGSLSSGMYNPLMGLAAGLLGAAGPSRMPVSLGQALGQGLQTGQQFQSAGLQNAMQQLMMGQTMARLRYALQGPPGSEQQTQTQAQPQINPNTGLTPDIPTPTSNALDALIGGASPQQADSISRSQVSQSTNDPNGVSSPVQQGITDPSQDPVYQYYARGAMIGMPGASDLAGQRREIIMGSPQYLAAVEQAKSQVTPINVRQGGGVYIPGRGLVFQLPRLPEGATLDNKGNVSMAPGSPQAIVQSEGSVGLGKLFGEPATYVDTTGATRPTTEAGNIFGTTNPFSFTTNGPTGGGRVTALPPAVSGGMAVTGKEATQRANDAIERQPSSQQTIGQLGQLEANLNALGTSPGKQAQLDVKNTLSSIGGFLGLPGLSNADLTNAAAARKTIVNLTAPMVRAMGAREPFQMVSFIRDGMASITNPSDANAIVIGMLRGLAEYQNSTGKYAGDFLNKNNGTGFAPGTGAWDAQWQSHADPMAYILENLPPFEQQSIMQAAAKNKSLGSEFKRAQNSANWLIQNGYMRQEQDSE